MNQKLSGLKIAVITSGHNALDGRVYDKHARSMADMGAEVTVVGMMDGADPPDGIPIIRLKLNRSRFRRFFIRPWQCLWASRKLKPDIIHFHDAELLQTVPLAHIIWPGVKIVYDAHEDFSNLILIREWLPASVKIPLKRAIDFLEKSMAGWVDGVVSVTEPLTNRFKHRFRTPAHNFVSKNFIAAAGETLRKPGERKYDLAHLGAISTERAGFLMKVLKGFHQSRPQARSLIIGVPDYLKGFFQDAPGNCEVMGQAPYSQIPSLLTDCRVGIDVHPELKPHLKPALPVKVIEYMCCGCAVVTSPMPVLESIAEKYSIPQKSFKIVRSGEPEDYVQAVLHQLEAIDNGVDLGAPLRELTITDLNWESEANRIADLYLTILNRAVQG